MNARAKRFAPWFAIGVLCFLSAVALWYEPLAINSSQTPATVVALQVPIASTETAVLTEVTVKPGDTVQKGQLLARLDTSALEREKAVAEAKLRELLSSITAASSSLASDDFDARTAHLREAAALNAELEDLKRSQRAAASERTIVQNELNRQRRLVADGLTNADRAEDLAQRLQLLEVELKLAPEKIQAKQRQINTANDRAASWQAQFSSSNAKVVQARTQPLQQAAEVQRKAIEALEKRIAAAVIQSPVDGAVLSLAAFSGTVARAGEPFLILEARGRNQIVAFADNRSLPRFPNGARVSISRLAEPRKALESTVSRINSQVTLFPERFWAVSTTPQYGTEIYIPLPAGADFRPGEALNVKPLPGAPN
jgi:multidrug resistance efflux pump